MVTFENRFTFAEGMNDQKLRFLERSADLPVKNNKLFRKLKKTRKKHKTRFSTNENLRSV